MKYLILLAVMFISVSFVKAQSEQDSTQVIQNTEKTKPSAEQLYSKGNYNINKGKFEDALKNFNDALLIDSSFYRAYHGRGTAELSLSMFKEAIKDYTHAITFKFNFAEAFYARGIAKLAIGDNDGACRDFHQAHDFNLKEALDMMDQYCR